MNEGVILERIDLIPVLELVPSLLACEERESPEGADRDLPEAWFQYWSDSLADAGVTGLVPLGLESWHVPVAQFADPARLERVLTILLRDLGGIEVLDDPELRSPLRGGLALHSAGEVLVEPTCCADLADLYEWSLAAKDRTADWRALWIGHPWLTTRYEEPWLRIAGPHDPDPEHPVPRWSVQPAKLQRAVEAAAVELESFAERVAIVLPQLGYPNTPLPAARHLAGLCR